MKKNRLREEILRQTINHLDWLCCTYGYYRMSYPELCQYVYRVYTKQLEPLRLQYLEGQLNERMHWLLTRGYKYARELCRNHDIAWPPPHESSLYSERLSAVERSCKEIVDDFQRLQRGIEEFPRRIEALKIELKRLKRWSKHLN